MSRPGKGAGALAGCRTTTVESPLGPLLLASDGAGLRAVLFAGGREAKCVARACESDDTAPPFPEARRELAEYFAGRRTAFDLPLRPAGTAFQQRVWEALRRIPHGATATYGEVARAVSAPRAARAVGAACHRNPLAILVPCHRVVGAGGALTGYAGGLARKRSLLALEAAPVR